MATFIMQALGCEVSAINTVHYSQPTHPMTRALATLQLTNGNTFIQVTIRRTSKSKGGRRRPTRFSSYTKA